MFERSCLACSLTRKFFACVFALSGRSLVLTATQSSGGDLEPVFDESMYGNGNLPVDLICMHMTPDGKEWWVGGQSGMLKSVSDPYTAVPSRSHTAHIDLVRNMLFFLCARFVDFSCKKTLR